ncbi:MAG: hypothetical protein HY764_04565, partial [Candidatus Portnoybacteria bacterium]|nr:hypothetical protein [Candidatus Portnoybacteria bacterium]
MEAFEIIKKYKLASSLSGLVLLFLVFLLVLEIINYQKIARGVFINGEDFGGLSYQSAKEKISAITEKAASQPIEFKYQDKKWVANLEKLGTTLNPEET